MSQQKKLELPERIREFRRSIRLSQDEFGERLGVSGNYISMIELGKKSPGPSLRKLFEAIELSPEFRTPGFPSKITLSNYVANPMLVMLSMETLIQTFAEVAQKLAQVEDASKKKVVASLRDYLDEIEHRLLAEGASSGELSEAQQMAMKAAKSGGHHAAR